MTLKEFFENPRYSPIQFATFKMNVGGNLPLVSYAVQVLWVMGITVVANRNAGVHLDIGIRLLWLEFGFSVHLWKSIFTVTPAKESGNG